MQPADPGQPGVPHPPYDELRAATQGDPEAAAHVEALREALDAQPPDRAAVEKHTSRLRGIAVLEARIANWWDDPATQSWIKAITDAGL
jgi:hypothetical protein